MSVLNFFKTLSLIFALSLFACSQCDDDSSSSTDDCEDCLVYSTPTYCDSERDIDEGDIRFLAKLDSLNSTVKVRVYRGEIEEGNLVIERDQVARSKSFSLPNGTYSAVAIYKTESEDLIVLKSFEIEPRKEDVGDCEVCYYPANVELDLWPDEDSEQGE